MTPPTAGAIERAAMSEDAAPASPAGSDESSPGAKDRSFAAARCASCCSFLTKWHSEETMGYIYDSTASGAIIVSNFYLTFAVTYLASEAAGCDVDVEDDDYECDKTIGGVKPENVMAYVVTIAGLVCAAVMPIAGAIVGA